MTESSHSARLVSALADPGRLRVLSRVVLAGPAGITQEDLDAAEPGSTRALARLIATALVRRSDDGRLTADHEPFAQALRPAARQDERGRPAALAALFTADGRLTSVPVRRELRRALLEYLTGRMFRTGTVYSEGEVNIAIRQYWDDCPAMRRYLVENGLLVRTADGSRYQVAA
ncbi:DUF2087 domain-containing protein [Peterkaempfera griseoplana]|uniref:DUF2087 domain-containing protein n=1 Tax=Peterkaempfera griseoplana TaxID=66896 RepID=UPI0006E13FB5|nr:DUF2087 domain-containing protein [Peterkaempfera griseoplana]